MVIGRSGDRVSLALFRSTTASYPFDIIFLMLCAAAIVARSAFTSRLLFSIIVGNPVRKTMSHAGYIQEIQRSDR